MPESQVLDLTEKKRIADKNAELAKAEAERQKEIMVLLVL